MAADKISEILKNAKTIAVVGLSNNRMRAAFGVAQYMQSQGYRIIPVHPSATEALGEKVYPTLLDVPEKIDIVDVFRRSDAVPEIVEQAIRLKVPVLWLQEGVIHEQAAQQVRDAGIEVVMDKCILKEHRMRS